MQGAKKHISVKHFPRPDMEDFFSLVKIEKEDDISEIKKKLKKKDRILFGNETIGKHFDGWFELCRAMKSLAYWDFENGSDLNAKEFWERSLFFDYYELYLEVHG